MQFESLKEDRHIKIIAQEVGFSLMRFQVELKLIKYSKGEPSLIGVSCNFSGFHFEESIQEYLSLV